MFRKRWLIALFILWALAVGQLVQGHTEEEQRIVEVFAQVGGEEQTSRVEYFGICEREIEEAADRERMLRGLAEGLGITEGVEITSADTEGRETCTLRKMGEHGDTELSLVTAEVDGEPCQYLTAQIHMDGGMEDALAYRERLEALTKDDIKVGRSSADMEGSYPRRLSLEERNRIADELLGQLDAAVVEENRTENLYEIYAYTPWFTDYRLQDGAAVNVTIAMDYSESESTTNIPVAVPVLEH